MSRTRIDIPDRISFQTLIAVRITDINYGGHVGNDQMLSMIHEARVQFLRHLGFEEMNVGGAGLIMRDVAIEFRQELFYGDTILAFVGADAFSKIGFDLYYRFEKEGDPQKTTVMKARTGMVCYDYRLRKIAALPEAARKALSA